MVLVPFLFRVGAVSLLRELEMQVRESCGGGGREMRVSKRVR